MLVLTILAIGASVAAFLFGLGAFEGHVNRKFGHRFFTMGSFLFTALSFAVLIGGEDWYRSAAHSHQDTLNGLVLCVIGAAMILWVVISNIRRTNLAYGVGGSAIQLPIFAVLAYFGIIALAIGFALMLVGGASSATPVRIVN